VQLPRTSLPRCYCN